MRAVYRTFPIVRSLATNVSAGAKPAAPIQDPLKNVVGLSAKCVKANEQKNVPGAGKEYKPVEYFGYNKLSYYEAEIEMERFRIPQPVAPRK